MKVAIVTTPIRPSPTRFPPFGSMAIIMSLRKILPKKNVMFYNIDFHRFSREEVKKYFKETKFDAVGISAVVSTAYEYTKFLTQAIKNANSNTIVFVGGGLSASSHILLKKAKVDYTILGDGEIIVQNLIKQLITGNRSPKEMEKIKGICFLNENNEMIFTGYEKPLPAPLVERPDFTILEEDKSINHFISSATFKSYDIKNQKPKKSTIVIVAKGCVARCTFCHRFEKGYRVSPNESIINHIKFLRDKYGIGHVGIGDENFGSYKEETLDLIKKIHSLGLTWHAGGVRAHTISYETLKKWKEYGCSSVMFGIESGSPRMLKVMEKKITLEQNIAALKDVYDAKLLTVIQLVIGMPGETDETINETIDFLIKTMPYYPDPFRKHIDYLLSVNYAQSLPGTPLYEYARDNGFIGKDIDSEEKYLLDISDKDAYDNDHYINFSHQPLLKVYTWRHMINWKVWRHYALNYLNFNFKKHQIIWGILCFYFNKKLNLKLNSSLLKAFSNFENQNQNIDTHDYNFAKSIRIVEMFKLLLPWNNLTYPLLCIVVAWKESQNLNWFFKLLFDHIKWSMKKNDLSKLPDITLRKITSISDLDQTVELRKGR